MQIQEGTEAEFQIRLNGEILLVCTLKKHLVFLRDRSKKCVKVKILRSIN